MVSVGLKKHLIWIVVVFFFFYEHLIVAHAAHLPLSPPQTLAKEKAEAITA